MCPARNQNGTCEISRKGELIKICSEDSCVLKRDAEGNKLIIIHRTLDCPYRGGTTCEVYKDKEYTLVCSAFDLFPKKCQLPIYRRFGKKRKGANE